MDSLREEYITSINFVPREIGFDSNFECRVETNLRVHILTINPIFACNNENAVDVFFVAPDLSAIDPNNFLDAQLLKIVENFDELKKDSEFSNRIDLNENFNKFDSKFVKFETSMGNFYVIMLLCESNKNPRDSWKFKLTQK